MPGMRDACRDRTKAASQLRSKRHDRERHVLDERTTAPARAERSLHQRGHACMHPRDIASPIPPGPLSTPPTAARRSTTRLHSKARPASTLLGTYHRILRLPASPLPTVVSPTPLHPPPAACLDPALPVGTRCCPIHVPGPVHAALARTCIPRNPPPPSAEVYSLQYTLGRRVANRVGEMTTGSYRDRVGVTRRGVMLALCMREVCCTGTDG
ncbi:hypothetical protein PMIN01_08935 [Paraphaeosphaeria minitans]|uniref:Uncharacterized protein n=1 Tax=Paraphaeosphaeria minitans TaxID=565426 RepID=A0A9P6KNP9_9PLEO|nr:hypothetical protein PMIN01_08935 [Paraphaeosphaeria minitans]